MTVPAVRVRARNAHPVNGGGEFVLYWMIANRRARSNFALQHARDLARALAKPLLVLEALRCDYDWASDRLHDFVIAGMLDNSVEFADVTYYPYIEPRTGAGKGLLQALAARACAVITDDFPCFFLPRMVEAAAEQVNVRLETVDSNGLYPLYATDREFAVAHSFRRHLQKELAPHLSQWPEDEPLQQWMLPQAKVPDDILKRWPMADPRRALGSYHNLPIDHDVPPSAIEGGPAAARRRLQQWLSGGLSRYAEDRNHPDEGASSGLSPWLHFGHISAHEVARAVWDQSSWTPQDLTGQVGGRRGWWGLPENAEAFMDELVTWRELGYHFCRARDDYDQYESLPEFALQTLQEHASDAREFVYTLEQFENADTHDSVWNAAQRQLRAEGRIHNYLRMQWGKGILAWSASPQEALATLIELNNRWALDGRNPNSYSGIFWTLGRFDRAWGPERRVFGKVRYMSSSNTRRKVRMEEYLLRFGRG